ncbi:MAG: Bax inhibitor-1 family protein [Aureisphaera sp.]
MSEIKSPEIPKVAGLDSEARVAFYRKTYTHLALAVLLFIVVESIFFRIPAVVQLAFSLTQGSLWLIMLGGFMLVTTYAEKMAVKSHDKNQQYLGLLLYVVAEAFIFVPLLLFSLEYAGSGILYQAAIITISLFMGLSAIVFITKKDFSFLKSALMIGGFVAIGLIVAGILFGFNLGLVFSVGMVVLAGGSILYQTSNMIHRYEEDQYVAASLGLFASLMLLFWYVLSILGND